VAEFSKASKERLATCDPRLQQVFNEVIKFFDCKILEGHRGKAAQHKAYMDGDSKVDWPDGKHNSIPSKAVDAMPYPIDWNDWKRICYFAGFVVGIAAHLGIMIRWGRDWDRDTDLNDQTFNDGPHYELVEGGIK